VLVLFAPKRLFRIRNKIPFFVHTDFLPAISEAGGQRATSQKRIETTETPPRDYRSAHSSLRTSHWRGSTSRVISYQAGQSQGPEQLNGGFA